MRNTRNAGVHVVTEGDFRVPVHRRCALALAFLFAAQAFAQAAPQGQNQPDGPQKEQPSAAVAAATSESKPSRLPTVTYQNGQLTIVAYNSTLSDVLEAVRSQTGATIDIPPGASEHVFVRLGPDLPRRVLDLLLKGSSFNFAMLGSGTDPELPSKVLLFPKTTNEDGQQAGQEQAAKVAHNRFGSAIAQPQSSPELPVQEAEQPAVAKEAVTPVVAKQDDAPAAEAASPKVSASAQQNTASTEPAPVQANTSADDHPRTPNIRTAEEVLQDLYARRRQSMEQQH